MTAPSDSAELVAGRQSLQKEFRDYIIAISKD
jgi:hypothetical protein